MKAGETTIYNEFFSNKMEYFLIESIFFSLFSLWSRCRCIVYGRQGNLSLLLFLPAASVLAAAVRSRPGQRHVGLPHGAHCLPHGLPSEPLRRGCDCESRACCCFSLHDVGLCAPRRRAREERVDCGVLRVALGSCYFYILRGLGHFESGMK